MSSPTTASTTGATTRVHAHRLGTQRADTSESAAPFGPSREIGPLRERLAQTTSQLHQAAWLIELLESLANTQTHFEAASEVAEQLRHQLRAERVVLAWDDMKGKRRIVAVSDCPNADRQTESMMQLQAAVDEASDWDGVTCWPVLESSSNADDAARRPLVHRQLAGSGAALTIPLESDSKTFGSLTLIGPSRSLLSESLIQFLSAAVPSLTSVLRCIAMGQPSRFTRGMRWLVNQPANRAISIAAAFIAFVALAAYPMPYRIGCPTLVEPVQRSFCVAPHDGIVQTTFVTPGDLVSSNQPLAQMDGKDLRWELAGLYAERSHAAKKRDTERANHETAQTLQSELEVKRLQARIDLLKHRQSGLTISSPLAGMVLSGNMERRENLPVEQGQVLYEIAPLDEMRIELSVPNDQIGYIETGQAIELTFDGLGTEAFAGTVRQIRPRSESRNQQNVFVIECELENASGRLRPGMTGHAKIITSEKPVAWIAFHRAFENLRMMMPW